MKAAAPDGIDVYFDNVGGDHLEAALSRLNLSGRVAMCTIAQYNETRAPAAFQPCLVIGKNLTLRGFIVAKYASLRPQFLAEVGPWPAAGEIPL